MVAKIFDLPAYLSRIGLKRAPDPNADGLAQVQWAQLTSIVFENLDIAMGRRPSLDPDALFAKLVTKGRGGYCHECNSLLQQALSALGYQARLLAARVRTGRTEMTGRTHTLVLVELADGSYIADAGFGAQTPRAPLRLANGASVRRGNVVWRLTADRRFGWSLTLEDSAGPQPLYLFDLGTVYPADVALSNHWSSSHPDSLFMQGPLAVRHEEGGRRVLFGGKLVRRQGAGQRSLLVQSLEALLAVLRDDFAITLSPNQQERQSLAEALERSRKQSA